MTCPNKNCEECGKTAAQMTRENEEMLKQYFHSPKYKLYKRLRNLHPEYTRRLLLDVVALQEAQAKASKTPRSFWDCLREGSW